MRYEQGGGGGVLPTPRFLPPPSSSPPPPPPTTPPPLPEEGEGEGALAVSNNFSRRLLAVNILRC